MALLLIGESATVTVAHSKTRDLPDVVRRADIVVAAVGRPEMVEGDWIKPGAVRHRRRHQPDLRPTTASRGWSATSTSRAPAARGCDHSRSRRRRPDDHRHAFEEYDRGRRARRAGLPYPEGL